jgi:hypothetical protein
VGDAHISAPLKEYWQLDSYPNHTTVSFVGKDEYVCYDGDADILGSFAIRHKSDEDLRPQYSAKYTLHCEGMKRKEGTLTIKFPEMERPTRQAGAQT